VADLLSLRFQHAPAAPWAPAGTLQEVFKQRVKMEAASAKKVAAKRESAMVVRSPSPHPHSDATVANRAGKGFRVGDELSRGRFTTPTATRIPRECWRCVSFKGHSLSPRVRFASL
jgi:hypothetical protein